MGWKIWMLLLASVCLLGLPSSGQEAEILKKEYSQITPSYKDSKKGTIDGLVDLITTTLQPINDPKDCPSCECGLVRKRSRIIGGHVTKVLEFPWMALLMYKGKFYCGGSLLNDYYVLTAAHCTVGFRKEKLSIRFLEHDQSNPNETNTIERKVSAIIRHSRYNPVTIDNDIALLKLNERVDLTNSRKRKRTSSEGNSCEETSEMNDVKLSPVCLPSPKLSYTAYKGVVSGWGTTEENGSVSDFLQEVYVPIISNKDCRQTSYKESITDNMLCAGFPEGGKDACQGDSGGPLHIFNNDTSQYQEVGIVSWGEGCAQPDYPGVYTRVNRYLTWIKRKTKDACYCQ